MDGLLKYRRGALLSDGMILKKDHFLSGFNDSFPVFIAGAPNFRQEPSGLPLYGVGQPTISGMRTMLNELKLYSSSDDRKAIWINLREEPVIWINSRPFVLREAEYPFQNITDFEGMSADRLARIEDRLKAEILAEAEQSNWNIVVHDEMDMKGEKKLRPNFESANKKCVKTSAEVALQLQKEGYSISFQRLPMTAEGSFDDDQVDSLLAIIQEARQTPNTALIFNCQMGRGRSTIAMLHAFLAMQLLSRGLDTPLSEPDPTVEVPNYHIIDRLKSSLGLLDSSVKFAVDAAIHTLGQVCAHAPRKDVALRFRTFVHA
jgi:hypothetical protein